MKQEMVEALLGMYQALESAGEKQRLRGTIDIGERSKVTAGTHMARIVEIILDDLIARGFNKDELAYLKSFVTLPGYLRVAKQWDILCFDQSDLIAAIELKSINVSFGNNINNRVEEAIGNAIDLNQAAIHGLIPWTVRPPARCYGLIVRDCEESRKPVRSRAARYPIDSAFDRTNYQEQFRIMGRRFLSEHIYEAVWLAIVDPDRGTAKEPDDALSYDVLIEAIASQLRMKRVTEGSR